MAPDGVSLHASRVFFADLAGQSSRPVSTGCPPYWWDTSTGKADGIVAPRVAIDSDHVPGECRIHEAVIDDRQAAGAAVLAVR
jgi:hypothetical protein